MMSGKISSIEFKGAWRLNETFSWSQKEDDKFRAFGQNEKEASNGIVSLTNIKDDLSLREPFVGIGWTVGFAGNWEL